MAYRKEKPRERYGEEFERKLEERVESTRRRSSNAPSTPRTKRSKAPSSLRFLAWTGIILLCFVVGYQGTSYVLVLLEDQSLLKNNDIIQNSAQLEARLSEDKTVAADDAEIKLDIQKRSVSLFYPKDGVMMKEEVDFIASTNEDYIQETIGKMLTLSGLFEKDVYVKHVFRNVDTIYLDFSPSFISALSRMGDKSARLFVTGIVRSMRDNFSIARVRFLIDGKVTTAGSPVDLTATWQLPK